MSVAKILVVEDEGLTAMELQRKLKTWGYEVPSFVFSCKEAIKKAKEIKPDLILMDVMLKGKGDGIDAAQEINSFHDIPIIYLTAYDDLTTRKRAEVTNPMAYLIKPFEENELQDKIKIALREHKKDKRLVDIGKRLDNKLKDFGIIVIDSKGLIRYINSLASKLTGFSNEVTLYKELHEIFPIEGIKDEKDVENHLRYLIDTTTGITSRSILKGKNGNEVHVEYNITSIVDEKDGFLGADLVFEDITQEVKDEKSVKEREKKFRNIFYQSMVATEIFDEKGKFLDANSACLSLFGAVDSEQLQKFNLFEDFKLNPEEIESLQKGLEVQYECEFNHKELAELGFNSTDTEKIIFFNLFITPLKLEGIVDGYLVQFQDVTDHRRLEESLRDSEEQYLKFLDELDQVLIVFNHDLKCIYCNKVINTVLGSKPDDLIGKSFKEFIKSWGDDELKAMCMGALETGKPSARIKTFQMDEKSIYIEIRALKSFEGLKIFLRDVTWIKQREKELERNENLYHSVVDDQSEMICRFNQDLELTFANEAYYLYFGLNNERNSVFSLSEADMNKMKVQLQSFNEKNPIKVFEGPIQMPDGEISWWQWVTRAKFDEKGKISEYQSVGHDTTSHHKVMEEVQTNLKELQSAMEDKNNELKILKKSFELEIGEEKEKISSLQELNEDMDKKFQEESQKLEETIKNQNRELEVFKDRESALKDKVKLFEKDIQTKSIEFEDSRKELEAEINIRKKTEENLRKISFDLEEQIRKNKEISSRITNLKKEIEEKEAEISQLQSDFRSEVSKIKKKEARTREELHHKEKTLKNVYNGVKINMQMISTLNRLHSEYVTDQMIEKLQDGRSYLRSFGLVHEKLYQSEDLETVDLGEYLDSVLDDIARSHGAKNVEIKIKTNDIVLDMETTVLSGIIISEIVINSLKHGFPGDMEGTVRVEVLLEEEDLIIKVSDDGVGIPSDISVETIDSFGLQLVKTLVEQYEGTIEFTGTDGTDFVIKIPKA